MPDDLSEKPDRFGGTTKEKATEWVDRFERIVRHNKWTKIYLAKAIDIYLDGTAYKWLLGLESRSTRPTHWEGVVTVVQEGGNAQQNTTHGLKSLFLRRFASETVKRLTERKLRNRMQRKDEDIAEYYYDILDMCRIVQKDMSEEARVDHLLRGVNANLYERL